MTPASNTVFAVVLFFALAALNLWTVRRRRRTVSGPPSGKSSPELQDRCESAAVASAASQTAHV
jgi:hypothetical protein